MLHRPPLLLQLVLLPVVQSTCFGLEPRVNLILRPEVLVYVSRLVDQIQHHIVFDTFAEFVGVDIATEFQSFGVFKRLDLCSTKVGK